MVFVRVQIEFWFGWNFESIITEQRQRRAAPLDSRCAARNSELDRDREDVRVDVVVGFGFGFGFGDTSKRVSRKTVAANGH